MERTRGDGWKTHHQSSWSNHHTGQYIECVWGGQEVDIFKSLWNLKTPPKVAFFLWRVFHNRLPTKVNLKSQMEGTYFYKTITYHARYALEKMN